MKRYSYPDLDEVLYRETLPNGLEIAVAPRRGFAKKIAYFVTNYGSIHTEFTLDGKKCTVPAGVAHYLEHKMFELPGGRDVTGEFAALGAAVNAFTASLALELRPFNIRVGVILPGRDPQTRFGENARRTMGQLPESYAALGQQILDSIQENASVTRAVDVAQAVWRMVNDPDAPSRLPAGEDALAMAQASRSRE